jgi:hypothetical protein
MTIMRALTSSPKASFSLGCERVNAKSLAKLANYESFSI